MTEKTLADAYVSKNTLLTTEQTATLLNVEVETLERWRADKSNGPDWIYVGKNKSHVRYHPADIEKFIDSKRHRPNNVAADLANA